MGKLKTNNAPKTRFSIAMPVELAKMCDETALSLGINRNAFINLAISTFIENKKVTSAMDSVKDSMINKFNFEFEKMLNSAQNIVEKAKVK